MHGFNISYNVVMSKDLIDTENVLLVVACAGAINQELYQLIELLNLEIQILKRLLNKRPKLHNDERRRLAAMANELDRRILKLSEHIVTIDSLRRWYRKLIARTYTAKNRGRKRMDANQEALICKIALANPTWARMR